MADAVSPEDRWARARSFGQAAADYQRLRPDYPVEAVSHLVGGTPAGGRILDLGAGTGKLTATDEQRERWMAGWRDVLATDPAVAPLDFVKIPMTTECWLTRLGKDW